MKLPIGFLVRVVGVVLSAIVCSGPGYSAVIYSSSIVPGSTPNTGTDTFPPVNCLGSDGCFYTGTNGTGAGFLVQDMSFGGVMPPFIPLRFAVSAAQKTAITNATSGSATLLIQASRDIGQRQQAGGGFLPATEWLTVQIGSTAFGELFKGTQSSCPPGETAGSADCGPNFHTDFQTHDTSNPIDQATLLSAISNDAIFGDRIEIDLVPTPTVGRLKIFSATLTFVPEPSTVAVLTLGGLLLGWRLRQLAKRP